MRKFAPEAIAALARVDPTDGGRVAADVAPTDARGAARANVRRRRHVLSRALIRHAAAAAAGCAAADVRLVERAPLPPRPLLPDGTALCASLSHSGDWIAGIVGSGPVGIDVEAITRARDERALGRWFFTPAEHAWMEAQPDVRLGFYTIWTGREAAFKLLSALGRAHALVDVALGVAAGRLVPPPPVTALQVTVLSAGAPPASIDAAAVDWPSDARPDATLVCSVAVERAHADSTSQLRLLAPSDLWSPHGHA